MTVTIDYYLSLNSPWTFLGSALFAEIAARNDVTVNVKPAKFGPIFEQTGGLPLPKRSPQRRAYRLMELKRWREVRAIPLNVEPKYFPCDDTVAVRLVIAARAAGQERSPAIAGTGARGVGAGGNARRSRHPFSGRRAGRARCRGAACGRPFRRRTRCAA